MLGMIYESQHASPIAIDNRLLDGFVESLKERDCANSDCHTCGYCEAVAHDVVKIDTEYQSRCLELANGLLNDIRSGAMWNVGENV